MANLIKLEGTRIIFRNLAGKPDKFNPAGGKRQFSVIVPNDLAKELERDGWNIKYLKPRDDEEEPTAHLPVKVSFNNRPPKIYIISGKTKTLLTEETVNSLDYADIESVDIVITPYEYNLSTGASGVAAYCKNMYVNIVEDEFADKYNFDDDDQEDELPWE